MPTSQTFGFKTFVALRLVSALWIVSLVLYALIIVAALVAAAFFSSTGDSTLSFFIAAVVVVGAIGSVLLTRIILETIAVVFRIAENTTPR